MKEGTQNTKNLTKLMFVLVALSAIVGALYFFVQQIDEVPLDRVLVQIDDSLQNNQIANAKKLLYNIQLSNFDRHTWLRIIKRAYDISKTTNGYKHLEHITRKAIKVLPGAEELWAFYVEALLKQKKYAQASAACVHLKSQTFRSLRGEALLCARYPQEKNPLLHIEQALITSADATYFASIAQDLENAALYYDAAILHLKAGQVKQARTLLPFIGEGQETPALGRAMIAYDTNDINRALCEVQKLKTEGEPCFDLSLLSGHLNITTGQYAWAYDDYAQAIGFNKYGNWRIYQNLAILLWQNNNKDYACSILKHGLEAFPLQKNLLMTYTYYLGDTLETQDLLNQYAKRYPIDTEMEMYRLLKFQHQLPPEEQSTKLWALFNQSPTSRPLASYMVWFFLSNTNFVDAEFVLERYVKAGGDAQWTIFYKGLIELAKNNLEGALEYFSKATTQNGWESAYNKGVIYLSLKKYTDAFQAFSKAKDDYYANINININHQEKHLAHIYSHLALASFYDNKYVLARSLAQQALQTDKNNILAQRVLSETAM